MRNIKTRNHCVWPMGAVIFAVIMNGMGSLAVAKETAGKGLPVFEDLDVNSDGLLSLQEFLASPELDETYFHELDVNEDNCVSKQEWPAPPDREGAPEGSNEGGQEPPSGMNIEQTLSDQAQSTTIAFDALAFVTGDLCADSFLPPGKVADFSGFQYLRDNDPTGLGHNTDFVTIIAFNVLNILTESQIAEMVTLAGVQVEQISEHGYMRFPLMKAFRRLFEGDIPAGSTGLDKAAVMAYSAELYRLDGEISYGRAQTLGGILRSMTTEQKAQLDALTALGGVGNWDDTLPNPLTDLHLSQVENVAVMTYASEMYSWYAGSVEADVYFCPERQGTYFGSFYMKDMPAMGNPDFTIPSNLTADMGSAFLAALTAPQAALVTDLVDIQRSDLYAIVDARTAISTELRKFMTQDSIDQAGVLAMAEHYGELDGAIVYNFATHFTAVGQGLSVDQTTQVTAIREEWNTISCTGAYLYSQPVAMPSIINTDFLFGVGTQEGEVEGSIEGEGSQEGSVEGEAEGQAEGMREGEGEGSFILQSSEVVNGGSLPVEYTCDGAGATLSLEWSGAPEGTTNYAVIMHHVAPDMTKWYWILYNIPADVLSLPENVTGIGTLGTNSVNDRMEYAPPCSQGPGEKTYILTVYALSAAPQISVSPDQVNREVLLAAMDGLILGTAELSVVYSRPDEGETEGAPEGAVEGEGGIIVPGATLVQRTTGLQFTEGPACDSKGNIYFSDVNADTIYIWTVSGELQTFLTDSGGANGLFFNHHGDLLACQSDLGRLASITSQLQTSVIANTYAGHSFNEPNDLWADPRGGVYFTDPVFFGRSVVQAGEYVYYLAPDGTTVTPVITDMVRPNGLIGTVDGSMLYVADWGAGAVYRYAIQGDGTLSGKTLFASVTCDGMTIDNEGNLYLTENAVLVYSSEGQQIVEIAVPERPTNVEFGGVDRKTLFITAGTSLYSIDMKVQGVWPRNDTEGEVVLEGEGSAEGEGAVEGEGIAEGEGGVESEGALEGEGGAEGANEGESGPLTIVQQPKPASVYVGSYQRFFIETSGGAGTVSYDWLKDGTSLGAASSAGYVIENVTDMDAGLYSCVVSDGVTTLTSDAVQLTVYEPAATGQHTSDQDGDWHISLSELLRVIQFFNSGGFHCEAGTEDGYAPGSGSADCSAYSSDYNPQDWDISLSELLRMIQFYNSNGYHCQQGTEDGYAPDAGAGC